MTTHMLRAVEVCSDDSWRDVAMSLGAFALVAIMILLLFGGLVLIVNKLDGST